MKYLFIQAFLFCTICSQAQQGPWENPLRMAWSSDGQNFGASTIFQDSAGVPSVIHWKGDTLVAVFQWFRQPQGSVTWDRVAVKFSYDLGLSWTSPTPIVIGDLPSGYQRPFDPTLAIISADSLRIYFSSSENPPMGGLSEVVNTYSAKTSDGIHYSFEPNARVDVATKPVIDPAVIYFNNSWHYTAPAGAPQDGAYHYLSNNGLDFVQVMDIPSDVSHNWTGNMMLYNDTELRFYGSGPSIWYNSSENGGMWNGFVSTNIHGGDPSVVQLAPDKFLMVFVGMHVSTDTESPMLEGLSVSPNPSTDILHVHGLVSDQNWQFRIYDTNGRLVSYSSLLNGLVSTKRLQTGIYFLQVESSNHDLKVFKFAKN